ncbi:subunit of the poxvirus multiprotein entry-fusion complex [Squirrelpox virus]|uniref:Subunit of the poxvirus multiprotein entry-fusion complex n=1 Tax=Squirrelpox virus TaxID=240426 RepID=U3UBH9_9POXV|nr:subunit of the poxvirus multiprotein entry-fusion complex [Squirrelpox virus]CCD83249.1 subunit of the poxvirus multiprotein entry-fusion complex [Squirrelpox virus]
MIQMGDRTTLSVHGLDLEYAREREAESVHAARASTLCFFVLVLAASAVLLWLQVSDNGVVTELTRYARIKESVRGLRPLVQGKADMESDRGRQLAANNKSLLDFHCVDFGAYYLPTRLDKSTFLPQAVRRGEGDGWMVTKAAPNDVAAKQFCEYVLRTRSDSVITCGPEMMRELGYSGYYEGPHWCAAFHDLLK